MKITKTKLKEIIREELLREAKEIYKVIFSDGNSMRVSVDKGKDKEDVLDFVTNIQRGKAGALSGAFYWTRNLNIRNIKKVK